MATITTNKRINIDITFLLRLIYTCLVTMFKLCFKSQVGIKYCNEIIYKELVTIYNKNGWFLDHFLLKLTLHFFNKMEYFTYIYISLSCFFHTYLTFIYLSIAYFNNDSCFVVKRTIKNRRQFVRFIINLI